MQANRSLTYALALILSDSSSPVRLIQTTIGVSLEQSFGIHTSPSFQHRTALHDSYTSSWYEMATSTTTRVTLGFETYTIDSDNPALRFSSTHYCTECRRWGCSECVPCEQCVTERVALIKHNSTPPRKCTSDSELNTTATEPTTNGVAASQRQVLSEENVEKIHDVLPLEKSKEGAIVVPPVGS